MDEPEIPHMRYSDDGGASWSVPLRTISGMTTVMRMPDGCRFVRMREENGRLLIELDATDAFNNPASAGFSFGAK